MSEGGRLHTFSFLAVTVTMTMAMAAVQAFAQTSATFQQASTPSTGAWSQLTNEPPVPLTACLLLTDGGHVSQCQRRLRYSFRIGKSGLYQHGRVCPVRKTKARAAYQRVKHRMFLVVTPALQETDLRARASTWASI